MQVFSSPSDLMKSTVVDESLPTTTTRVLFQRESTYYYFIIQQNEKSTKNYTKTTWDGSAATIQGLRKISIKGL